MRVFRHHLYEYRKGLRHLILATARCEHRAFIEQQLTKSGIAYLIVPLANGHINVFFGADDCIAVVRRIGKPCLIDYTPEEDFILGIMLGHDRKIQCERYLQMKDRGRAADMDLEESMCCGRSGMEEEKWGRHKALKKEVSHVA